MSGGLPPVPADAVALRLQLTRLRIPVTAAGQLPHRQQPHNRVRQRWIGQRLHWPPPGDQRRAALPVAAQAQRLPAQHLPAQARIKHDQCRPVWSGSTGSLQRNVEILRFPGHHNDCASKRRGIPFVKGSGETLAGLGPGAAYYIMDA